MIKWYCILNFTSYGMILNDMIYDIQWWCMLFGNSWMIQNLTKTKNDRISFQSIKIYIHWRSSVLIKIAKAIDLWMIYGWFTDDSSSVLIKIAKTIEKKQVEHLMGETHGFQITGRLHTVKSWHWLCHGVALSNSLRRVSSEMDRTSGKFGGKVVKLNFSKGNFR